MPFAIQCYLSLLQLAMHFITRATPMHYIYGKGHNLEPTSKKNYIKAKSCH